MSNKIILQLKNKFIANKDSIVAVLIRYLFYGIASVESFLLPLFFKGEIYANFEYYKNFIFIMPNFLLGSYSGFIFLKYSHKVDYFKQLVSVGYVVSAITAVIMSLFIQNFYLLIPFIIINIYTLIEQWLKVERNFIAAFAFKPIYSILSILFAFLITSYTQFVINPSLSLCVLFSLTFVSWLFLCKIPKEAFIPDFKISKFTVLRYAFMVKVIVSGVMASFLFSILLFFERFYVNKYYHDVLPSYSMAFNLSQIIVVILSAISYVSSVNLGESKDTMEKKKLLHSFKVAVSTYFMMFIGFIGFIYFISSFYKQFNDLVLITAIVTFGKGFYFLTGIFSPLAVYHGFNNNMFRFLLLLFIINISLIFFLIFLKLNLFILLLIDSFFIIIYALYMLHLVFNKIKYAE